MTSPALPGAPGTDDPAVERSVQRYRRLLVLYPRAFRTEYGDDLVQAYRDQLVHRAGGRTTWWSTARDLISSATRERRDGLAPQGGPTNALLVVLVAVALGVAVVGTGPLVPLLLLPAAALLGLPAYGVVLVRRAWVRRRTTGEGAARPALAAVGCFAVPPVLVVALGEDSGYVVFVAVFGGLVVGATVGVVWALATLATAPRARRRWRRPLLVLVPALAVLGVIIGASVSSYRTSLGPPGDHSVENASADSRALWDAARTGDVEAATRLTTETCADPWVTFPVDGGRHNAKGMAEARELELPDDQEGPYRQIAALLGPYQDGWQGRCGEPDG